MLGQKMVIASLEYTFMDKVADKDICINHIVAIERQDNMTVTIKLINGSVVYVKPQMALEIQKLWHSLADETKTISDAPDNSSNAPA